jgi:hypothetical protein
VILPATCFKNHFCGSIEVRNRCTFLIYLSKTDNNSAFFYCLFFWKLAKLELVSLPLPPPPKKKSYRIEKSLIPITTCTKAKDLGVKADPNQASRTWLQKP